MRNTHVTALFAALLSAALVSQPVLAKGSGDSGNSSEGKPVADKSQAALQVQDHDYEDGEQLVLKSRDRQFNKQRLTAAKRHFLRKMEQLRLTEKQKKQIQALLNEHEEDWIPGGGVPGELHGKVLNVLTLEQREQFAQAGRMGPGKGRRFN